MAVIILVHVHLCDFAMASYIHQELVGTEYEHFQLHLGMPMVLLKIFVPAILLIAYRAYLSFPQKFVRGLRQNLHFPH